MAYNGDHTDCPAVRGNARYCDIIGGVQLNHRSRRSYRRLNVQKTLRPHWYGRFHFVEVVLR